MKIRILPCIILEIGFQRFICIKKVSTIINAPVSHSGFCGSPQDHCRGPTPFLHQNTTKSPWLPSWMGPDTFSWATAQSPSLGSQSRVALVRHWEWWRFDDPLIHLLRAGSNRRATFQRTTPVSSYYSRSTGLLVGSLSDLLVGMRCFNGRIRG